ncbi:hypothetical protein ACOMHN_054798 [Nucella lapillus]
MHVQCTAQEENVRDTQSGQDSNQEKPREDVAWAELSAETYISDSKGEGRKIPEPETWKKEEITVAVGVIKDDEEGVSLTPREPSQTTSMADIEFGDNLSGKEKCELYTIFQEYTDRTVVCLGLGDPKGIAISFSHRRPDRVVAVNTALKTEYGGAIVGHGGSCQEEPSQYPTARCGAGVPVWVSKERPTDRLGISGLPMPTSLPVVADRGPSKRGHSKCVVRRGYSVWVGRHPQ